MTFWSEQCPSRGAALTHAHWDRCTPEAHPGEDSGHYPFQCCHCRGMDPAARMQFIAQPPPPDIDVQARLKSLGIMGSWAEMPDGTLLHLSTEKDTRMEDIHAAPEHDENTPVEPRAITGEGPQGPKYGIGRGEATPRFLQRVKSYVQFYESLYGPDGEPDE